VVDGACSTYGKRIGAYRVLMGKVRERHNLKDSGVDGRIFSWIFLKQNVGIDWIVLAQDRDR
jgi:hypothetical protein